MSIQVNPYSNSSFPNLNQIYAQVEKGMQQLKDNVDEVFRKLDQYVNETNKVFDQKKAGEAKDNVVKLQNELQKIKAQLKQISFVRKDIQAKLVGIEEQIQKLQQIIARAK